MAVILPRVVVRLSFYVGVIAVEGKYFQNAVVTLVTNHTRNREHFVPKIRAPKSLNRKIDMARSIDN